MRDNRWGRLVVAIACLLLLTSATMISAQDQTPQPGFLRNPLNAYGGADPWLTYFDGNYYLATTTWTSEWYMRRSPTLAGLKTAEPQRIYFETDPSRCCNFWAPEFHLLDGPNGPRWYFYYTAGVEGSNDFQHTHVLESEGMDPMGPYVYKARLFDPANDGWAIDGSILQLDGDYYFLYSIWIGSDQVIMIAPMENPWTLAGSGTVISRPQYDWERVGLHVNEAPVALYHDDQVFVVYSASFCGTPDYKLGLLTYLGGDPLSADSWAKHPEPVFQRSDENGVFGPGHNGFFKSPDGSEDWIVYHANDSLDGGCDGRRTTRVQRIDWRDDGLPDFGEPVSVDEVIVAPSGDNGVDPAPVIETPPISRFRSVGRNAYLRHINFQVRLDPTVDPRADSQFRVISGLADPSAVTIESVNFPGYFLRHRNNAISLAAYDGSETFEADVTWYVRPGLADASAISFEAYNRPGFYIGEMFGVPALVELTDEASAVALEAATYIEEHET